MLSQVQIGGVSAYTLGSVVLYIGPKGNHHILRFPDIRVYKVFLAPTPPPSSPPRCTYAKPVPFFIFCREPHQN